MRCPACKNKPVELFYSPGSQPLAAYNLPHSKQEAENAPRYPMNFYMCRFCGHVFNADFDYAQVPYTEASNLMFNSGVTWTEHLEGLANYTIREYTDYWQNVVVDIGAGDGGFLEILKQKAAAKGVKIRCVAFEPGVESKSCKEKGLETYADYFIPARDMNRISPSILLCRHVLEHLQEPRDFVADISYQAAMFSCNPLTFVAEVPCITKALNTYRFTDFLYEHVNNFTQRSLRVMFESAGWETVDEYLAYNQEVAVWVGRVPLCCEYAQFQGQKASYWREIKQTLFNMKQGLETRRAAGMSIAFFGGTGKSAAFLNLFELNKDIVVDSDNNKVGRFVPGTGQRIESVQLLKEVSVDTIVITTRWRAADIYAELQCKQIKYNELLILDGVLKEYTEEDYVKEAQTSQTG